MEDEFSYLREKEKAVDYFKEQNKIANDFLKDTEELRETIFDEIKSRLTDYESYPIKKDDYYYFYKDYKEKQYIIHYRRKGERDEVILDGNKLAGESKSLFLAGLKISDCHRYLAYLYSLDGSDRLTLEIKDLDTSKVIISKNEVADFEWFQDRFYYIKTDETLKPSKLYMGDLSGSEDLLYEEEKSEAFLYLTKSMDKKKLYLNSKEMESNEVSIINGTTIAPFSKRKERIDYFLENWHGKTIILSNEEFKDYCIYIKEEDSKRKIYSPPIGKIEDFYVFNNHIAIIETYENPVVKIIDMTTGSIISPNLPDSVFELSDILTQEFDSNNITVKISNPTTPESIYSINMETGEHFLLRENSVPGHEPGDYVVSREYAGDIPITAYYKKEHKNSTKALLSGYGSYSINYPVKFSSPMLSLLDRGFKHYIAHVRGGGEKGHQWYEDGKFLNKMNTFKDFIRVSEYLIDKGHTSKESLAIIGGSAGGLLVGVVLNMRPELYKAAIADVPFVDVLNTMLDSSLPLTTTEYEEWGNPNIKEYYDYIKSYSPYENVCSFNYPDTLITTSINDTRVGYWEPAKWHARLKKHSKNPNIFIKANLSGGHAGFTSKDDAIKEDICYKFAFLIKELD